VNFFDATNIFFVAFGYPLSYLEFFGVLSGAIAVWLSAKANVWSWPLGIVNVTLFFFFFYQTQFYPDMFLQVFFLITNIMGWWRWTHPGLGEEDRKNELRVSWMKTRSLIICSALTLAGALAFGAFADRLHEFFPTLFSLPSAFPYLDSFVTVTSITATYLMVQKKVECWVAWFIADVTGMSLYFTKGLMLVGIEYLVFCAMVGFGFWRWKKEFESYQS
jgi:nicotinamide mononucleotide transporter